MTVNQQKAPGGIEWVRIRESNGHVRPGYTWNVSSGCFHACRWKMPNGAIARCYAEEVAEGLAQAAYPEGFEHHYWHPERLNEPGRVREPAGIFLDSMGDLMGHWVTDNQIEQVLGTCEAADWHIFQLLTKNPRRLRGRYFPGNVWVGASSPPDFYRGSELSRKGQEQFLDFTLEMLAGVPSWGNTSRVRWMSFEPLSWDCSAIVARFPGVLQWAVIGAASNGREQYPPDESHLRNLLDVLDAQGVKVFYKGNLRSLPWAAANWRDAFPPV